MAIPELRQVTLVSCAIEFIHNVPAIQEVIEAYRWRNSVNGNFDELYPRGMSNALVRALLSFDAGYQAGQRESIEHAKREAKHQKAMRDIAAKTRGG